MITGFRRRLESLENSRSGDEVSIVIMGGLPGADPFEIACAGNLQWSRHADEEIGAFRARATAAARAAGQSITAFGGLPGGDDRLEKPKP